MLVCIPTEVIFSPSVAPPRIDRMPAIIYVPEGDNTKIKVFYGGDQPMEVSLSKGDKDIPASDHVRYTVFDDYIIILMKEVGKNDEGVYNLTLKNPSGSVSGTFTINVTGWYFLLKNFPSFFFFSKMYLGIFSFQDSLVHQSAH